MTSIKLNQELNDELYQELRRIAASHMRRERPGGLLQTTAIVHEAYLRLSSDQQSGWKDRPSFLAAAAVAMKRLLVDQSRHDKAAKRGGGFDQQLLTDTRLAVADHGYDAVELDEALGRLASFAPDQAVCLELMAFGGMTGEEIATHLGVSASTIDRRMRAAKAWLRRELSGNTADGSPSATPHPSPNASPESAP